MPEGLASEPIRALVPYKDGCVTPPQAHSLKQQMVSSHPQLVSPASLTWPHNCTPYLRDHADIARSSGDGHQDHHCCGERDYLAPIALHSRRWAANFAAYSLPQVAETRVLLLELVGSDSHSPLTLWEVVSGLAPWLTINGFHVCRSNQNPSLIYSLSRCVRMCLSH